MTALPLAIGLLLLVLGGEGIVRGASAIAARFGVPPLVIGLTLVGFGTSTPELFTSLEAAFRGAPGIAVGNVVGSNIANILLILGAAALLVLCAVTGWRIARWEGAALLALYAAYLGWLACNAVG